MQSFQSTSYFCFFTFGNYHMISFKYCLYLHGPESALLSFSSPSWLYREREKTFFMHECKQKPNKPHSSSAQLPAAWGESRTQSKQKLLNNPSLANKRPPKQRQPKAFPAQNKIVLGIVGNNAIKRPESKHLSSKTVHCSSESVYFVLKTENFFT